MRKALVIAVLLSFLGGLAYAAPIIDQNQPEVYLSFFRPTDFSHGDLIQSFQQAGNNVTGAGIFLTDYVLGTGDITISLYSALPTHGGTILASGTSTGTAGNWVDVFWSPVTVTPDTPLYLFFSSTNEALAVGGDALYRYTRGEVYVPANPDYMPLWYFDYTFRTYTETAAPVPEPATMLLLGSGLLGLAGWRRKFKK